MSSDLIGEGDQSDGSQAMDMLREALRDYRDARSSLLSRVSLAFAGSGTTGLVAAGIASGVGATAVDKIVVGLVSMLTLVSIWVANSVWQSQDSWVVLPKSVDAIYEQYVNVSEEHAYGARVIDLFEMTKREHEENGFVATRLGWLVYLLDAQVALLLVAAVF
ncbi:MAG: hypothetical protein AAGJ40_09355 [Planctomycetota bacterium]